MSAVVHPRLKLFCLPYAGGSANRIYRDWPRHLPPKIEVVPLELPGRATRFAERPYVRAENILTDALARIVPWRAGPLALFGHSMGAMLALELARRIEYEYGCPPAHLVVSGAPAPDLSPEIDPSGLSEMALRKFLVRLNAPPQVLADEELMALSLPTLRADLTAVARWRPRRKPAVSCPVTIIGADDDTEVDAGSLSCWGDYTTGPVALHMVPGGHLVIDEAPELIPRIVGAALSEGGARGPFSAPRRR
ncbi:thioesterase II family protein [Micromonospora sp. CA-248089]|uniref:thioesterase II family protein n=1 Tax=Micromonospora sp. CA-248089 TaxID=3239960 RepID=UPI003D8E8279